MTKDSIDKINYQQKTYPVSSEIKKRKEFSDREVGLTHPDLSSFVRLTDDGDIEIFAAPGIGIIISAKAKSISFFADSVKMFTKEDGLRWNSFNFNYSASTYVEPTLVKINNKLIHSSQNGVTHYLQAILENEQEQSQTPITITGDYRLSSDNQTVPTQDFVSQYSSEGLTEEQIKLIEAYRTDYSLEHILRIVNLIKTGLTFEEAHITALRESNE
jgi:hypothetical protein